MAQKAVNSCLIGFLILIFLFYALPSKIVIFVVKLKKSTSRLKDIIDLIQYIVFVFCGILGTCLTKWVQRETSSPSSPSSPSSTSTSVKSKKGQVKSESSRTEPKSVSPTSDASIVTVKVDEIRSSSAAHELTESSSTISSVSSSSSLSSPSAAPRDSNDDLELKCPDAFIEVYHVTNQLYQTTIEPSTKSSILTRWLIRLSLIISITLLNWNLHFDSFSPAMELFTWSSNISQITVGIMASTIFSGYIGELKTIGSSFNWINIFSDQCNQLADKMSTTVKPADLNQLIDFISTRYTLCVSIVSLTSPLKKFAFSLLFTVYLIALTSMTLDSTQSILTFKSTSGHYIVTTSTAIVSLTALFSSMSIIQKTSSKCSSSLCKAMLAYPDHLQAIYPRLYLVRSSFLSVKPKFQLFGSLRLEVPLFLMLSLIFMVEITRYVN